jgi:hypothetical protein
MSEQVAPLTLRIVNELQIVVGAMELGDYAASAKAVERVDALLDKIRAELVRIIKDREKKIVDEVLNHATLRKK